MYGRCRSNLPTVEAIEKEPENKALICGKGKKKTASHTMVLHVYKKGFKAKW